MKVEAPVIIYKDNILVVLNTIELGSNLNYKVIALVYHFYREYIAGGVVDVRKVHTKENLSDTMTKGLDSNNFHNFFIPFMSN